MEYDKSLYYGLNFRLGRYFAVFFGSIFILLGFTGELNGITLTQFFMIGGSIFLCSGLVHYFSTKNLKCVHCQNQLEQKFVDTTEKHIQESGIKVSPVADLGMYMTSIVYCEICQKYKIDEIDSGA